MVDRYREVYYTKKRLLSGVVKVSTGVMQLEKLSAGDASNRKPKYKR